MSIYYYYELNLSNPRPLWPPDKTPHVHQPVSHAIIGAPLQNSTISDLMTNLTVQDPTPP